MLPQVLLATFFMVGQTRSDAVFKITSEHSKQTNNPMKQQRKANE